MGYKEAIDSPEKVIAYMNCAYRFWCQKLTFIKKLLFCKWVVSDKLLQAVL